MKLTFACVLAMLAALLVTMPARMILALVYLGLLGFG
jgi:hypothetical protein